jgi:hypothetical protein
MSEASQGPSWWQSSDGRWHLSEHGLLSPEGLPLPPQSFFDSTPESFTLNAGVPRDPSPQAPKTNVFAVVSLILGVVWIWWVTSILAIVVALIALWQIKQRNQKGREMATVGLGFGMMWMVPLGYFFIIRAL